MNSQTPRDWNWFIGQNDTANIFLGSFPKNEIMRKYKSRGLRTKTSSWRPVGLVGSASLPPLWLRHSGRVTHAKVILDHWFFSEKPKFLRKSKKNSFTWFFQFNIMSKGRPPQKNEECFLTPIPISQGNWSSLAVWTCSLSTNFGREMYPWSETSS